MNARMKTQSRSTSAGRPPKFRETTRPVTVTLPMRILQQLGAVNPDRAQAIVRVTEAVTGGGHRRFKPVELVEVSPGKAIIVVGPCASLRAIGWLQLVEIARGRSLLVIPSGTAVDALEVAIMDLLDPTNSIGEDERSLLTELRDQLVRLRRGHRISKAEIILFDIARRRDGPAA